MAEEIQGDLELDFRVHAVPYLYEPLASIMNRIVADSDHSDEEEERDDCPTNNSGQ